MTRFNPDSRPRLAPGVRLQTDAVTGEPVLLYPEGVLVLNPTAHDIVQKCNGATSLHDIVAALREEYDIDEPTLRADAAECLADLIARNLVVMAP